MNIKENLAYNLTAYRKTAGLTQAELAQKLAYSDKAVSKWERGESIPDLIVLKEIADLYGVTIDELIAEPKSEKPKTKYNLAKKRVIMALCAAGLVWLIAICAYSFMGIIAENLMDKSWLSFIIAIPITIGVLLILTSVWGRNFFNALFTSLFIWTLIAAIYLSLINLLPSPPQTLWLIFLIGVPLQILTVLWFTYKIFNNHPTK